LNGKGLVRVDVIIGLIKLIETFSNRALIIGSWKQLLHPFPFKYGDVYHDHGYSD